MLDGSFETEVFRKDTDNNIYLNWYSFAPRSWKIGTLKGLFRRSYLISSTNNALDREIAFLKKVFTKINSYPSKVVFKTLRDVKKKNESETLLQVENAEVSPSIDNADVITPQLNLPFKGRPGENIINKFKKTVKMYITSNVEPRFSYKGTKLGSFFSVKDKVKLDHQSNLVYGYRPKYNQESTDYVGETRVRYASRMEQHSRTDKNSSVFKDSKKRDCVVSHEDCRILEKGYHKTSDCKIAEALYRKELKPILNEQNEGLMLQLFS